MKFPDLPPSLHALARQEMYEHIDLNKSMLLRAALREELLKVSYIGHRRATDLTDGEWAIGRRSGGWYSEWQKNLKLIRENPEELLVKQSIYNVARSLMRTKGSQKSMHARTYSRQSVKALREWVFTWSK